ncbi:peptide chain release factor family protein [Poriferisphaera corsica]|uniref:peptide chain release factor family protein n=1 Tax=Poriferisphaera corsica TaxID=2528020 RepID=UPI0011A94540|nr:peptide chain release factor-like protein [Poriferisphaera corsica]
MTTSTPSPHPATLPSEELLKSCTIERTRASGPGGQHRNKVETAIRITHKPSHINAQASERRSQAENQKMALFRLRINLAIDHRTAVSVDHLADYTPSTLWQSRCKSKRIACNPKHADFPALLAESLDILHAADFNPAAAATILNLSTSQLIKFIKDAPRAFESINRRRQQAGQHPLR